MKTFSILSLSLFVLPALAWHKYNGPAPRDRNGKLTTHQDPRINAKFTGATLNPLFTPDIKLDVGVKLGKRRLSYDDVPSSEDLAAIAKRFEGHPSIPRNVKRAAPMLNGVIVLFSGSQFVGYVQHDLVNNPPATISYTQDTSKVAFLTLPSATPAKYFDLAIINSTAPYIGTIGAYSGTNWGKGSPGFGSVTVVQKSTYQHRDVNNPTYLPSESNVWSINLQTGQLTGTWFNDNGAAVPCTIYIDVNFNDLGFTGDLNAFATYYNQHVVSLTAWFQPLW